MEKKGFVRGSMGSAASKVLMPSAGVADGQLPTTYALTGVEVGACKSPE